MVLPLVEILLRVAPERRDSVRLVGAWEELFPVLVVKTTERRPSTGRCPPKQLAARRQEIWLQALETDKFTDWTHVSNCHWHDGSLLMLGKGGGVAVGPVAVLTVLVKRIAVTLDVERTGAVVVRLVAILTVLIGRDIGRPDVVVVGHPLELTVAEN